MQHIREQCQQCQQWPRLTASRQTLRTDRARVRRTGSCDRRVLARRRHPLRPTGDHAEEGLKNRVREGASRLNAGRMHAKVFSHWSLNGLVRSLNRGWALAFQLPLTHTNLFGRIPVEASAVACGKFRCPPPCHAVWCWNCEKLIADCKCRH